MRWYFLNRSKGINDFYECSIVVALFTWLIANCNLAETKQRQDFNRIIKKNV